MEAEIADEEFQSFMRIARSLENTLKRPKDRDCTKQLLKQCERLNRSSNLVIKRNTNIFMKFLVRVLNWTSVNQPVQLYDKWYAGLKGDMKIWLQYNKTYMALKDMPNGVCAVYCAIATSPDAGWQEGALKATRDSQEQSVEL